MNSDPLIGRVIDGKYRIESEIGAGGMATVYRAMRLHIGDVVAIKILHSDLQRDPLFAERFRREAQVAARLKHPNVVAIYDFGASEDGVIYLVMELVEGTNLRSIVKDGGPMPAVLVAEIVRQVCAALTDAHRQHIVHRDLKPANVAVETTPDGPRVKVLDFGIARLRDGGTIADLTQTGTLLGTPAYLSPEQCLGEELDGRSDIYSLGVVLFEMLCGVVPFNSPTATAVIVQHVRDRPPPLRVLNVSVSPAVEAVVLRALAKRREDRPQTARALSEELAAAFGGTVLVAAPPMLDQDRTVRLATGPPPHASQDVSRANAPRRRTAGVLLGFGAAIVLVGGSFGVHQALTKRNENGTAARMAHRPSSGPKSPGVVVHARQAQTPAARQYGRLRKATPPADRIAKAPARAVRPSSEIRKSQPSRGTGEIPRAQPHTIAAKHESPVAAPARPRDTAPAIPALFTEVAIPSVSPGPVAITTGPDGALWFAEMRTGRYGRVTAHGAAAESSVPAPNVFLTGITSAPDGAIWIVESRANDAPGKLLRKMMSGEVREVALPTTWRRPHGVAVGADGALWLTLGFIDAQRNGRIGRMTSSGQSTEFELNEDLVSDPGSITLGPDGALWFAEKVGHPGTIRSSSGNLEAATMFTGGKIGRITTSGSITLYTVPRDEMPFAITPGPDGTVWFSTTNKSRVGRISTSGEFTEFTLPQPNSWAWYSMVIGGDGALWFYDYTANAIRRMPVGALGRPHLPD